MRSRTSTDYVNENDDTVSEFDASTCSGDNFYGIFENKEEIITEDSIFRSTLIRKFGNIGSLKSLSVILQRIPII